MKKLLPFIILTCAIIGNAQTPPQPSPTPPPARSTCNLTLKDAPSLKGISLGMRPNEISRILTTNVIPKPKTTTIFPKLVGDKYISYDEWLRLDVKNKFDFDERRKNQKEILAGESIFILNDREDFYTSNQKIEGIEDLKLYFFQNELYKIDITYDKNDVAWSNVAEFVDNISSKLNLAKEYWDTKSNIAFFFCKEFYLTASVSSSSSAASLDLENRVINKQIQEFAMQKYIQSIQTKKQEEEDKKKVFKP